METNKTPPMVWAGRVVSALPILGLTMSSLVKLSHKAEMVEQFTKHLGYPEGSLTPIGVVELLCVVLMAVPQTALFGAVLTTAYLGGAVATHVRVGEGFAPAVVLGVLVWLGLYLRDARLRELAPLRKLGGSAKSPG
jgi:hypothetical protein